jgi:hypothetical protein
VSDRTEGRAFAKCGPSPPRGSGRRIFDNLLTSQLSRVSAFRLSAWPTRPAHAPAESRSALTLR